jgi:ATP-dependent DNA ligase
LAQGIGNTKDRPFRDLEPRFPFLRVSMASERALVRPRGVWVKTKFLNRQEFVILGWTDPEGSRSSLGSLLLGYYRDDGKLICAGRAGTGIDGIRTEGLAEQTAPARFGQNDGRCTAAENHRFGTPLVLSRVHWVRPELVAEVTYLTWTADGLLRHVVYEGLREDKSAREVRRVG